MKINEALLRELGDRQPSSDFSLVADFFKKHYGKRSFSPQQFMRLRKLSSDIKLATAHRLMPDYQAKRVEQARKQLDTRYVLISIMVNGKHHLVVRVGRGGGSVFVYSDSTRGIAEFNKRIAAEERVIRKYWK